MAEYSGPPTERYQVGDLPTERYSSPDPTATHPSSGPRSYAAQRVERSRMGGRRWATISMVGIALGAFGGLGYVVVSGKGPAEVVDSPSIDTATEQVSHPNLPSPSSVSTTGKAAAEAQSQQTNEIVEQDETKVADKATTTGDSAADSASSATSPLKRNLSPVPATEQGGVSVPTDKPNRTKPKRLQTADHSINTNTKDLPPGTGTASMPDITTLSGPAPMELAPRPCVADEAYYSGHGPLPVADGEHGTPEQQAQFAMGRQIGLNRTCP